MSSTTSRITRSQMNQLIDHMDIYSNPDSSVTKTNWRDLTKSNRPKLIIMVGGPASGKSVVRSACAGECGIDDALILNPDNLMERMHGNDLNQRGTVNKDFSVLYRDIFNDKLGINIIYDRTGAYKDHTEFIIDLVRSGAIKKGNISYEIVLCIVVTPLDIGLARAISREREIGRSVPPEIIRRIYESIDSVIETYESNSLTRIFSTLKDAQKELSKKPSRKIIISDDGALMLPTISKGVVSVKPGNFTIELDPERRTQPMEFTTPAHMTRITREFYDADDEGRDDDFELSQDNKIYIDTDMGDRISFTNSHMLFDKIIAFDNTISNEQPKLIYLYDQGKVIVDKELSQMAKSTKDQSRYTRNPFDLLDTRTARLTAQGAKSRKTKKRKHKSKSKHRSKRNKRRKSKTKRRHKK